MWLESGDTNCLQCLGLRTASLRFDTKGRPYVVCLSCGSRTFLKGRAALAGLAILDEVVTELAQAASANPERAAAMQQRLDAFVGALQQRSRAVEPGAPRVVAAETADEKRGAA